MRDRNLKRTRALTLCGALAALSVVLLAIGELLMVLDLSMAVIASLLVIFAVIELGRSYAVALYAATAVLALLICPQKSAAIAYAFFAGYYPILKAIFESKFSRFWGWVLKILAFNAGFAVGVLVAVRLFSTLVFDAAWQYAALLLATPIFVLYDIALTRVITAYVTRWRQRFTFLHK